MDNLNERLCTVKMKRQHKKIKILKILSYTTIGLGFALMGYIAFLLFCPTKTLVVKNAPMPVINGTEFKAGDKIIYRYDYCKYYDAPIEITKQFVDGLIFTMDSSYGVANLPKGCGIKDVSVIVPQTLPQGTYRLRIITVIAVNQLRNDTVTYETTPFKITTHTDDEQDEQEMLNKE